VKRWEFRKRKFRIHPEKAYIYCTRPVQKVVGFFEVGKVISGPSGKIWELCAEYGGISRDEFLRRFGYGEVCAIEILKPRRIRPPVKLVSLG
jgi:predicted transcriptional regulator